MNIENNKLPQYVQDAIEFDVPLPATCEELAWEEKTHRVWYRRVDTMPYTLCNVFPCADKVRLRSVVDNSLVDILHIENFAKYVIPAPIARQISEKLPSSIKDGLVTPPIGMYKTVISYAGRFDCEIQNHHFAEAYAQLYTKLKQAGLLEK